MLRTVSMNDKIDLRIVKTQKKLTDALFSMMSEMPFDDITVFDLCERANIRRATFYKHYNDKYDFFKGVTLRLIENFANTLISNDDTFTPSNYFTRFVNEVFVYFEKRPVILSNLLESNTFPVMYDIITSCTHSALVERLTELKKSGMYITTDITFTANFINGGIAKIMLDWFKSPIVPKEILLAKIDEIMAKIFA